MPTLTVNDMEVQIVRKRVKHARITVFASDGRIRLTVPPSVTDAAAREMIVEKSAWIAKQREKFQQHTPQATLEYVAGELHALRGKLYPLEVIETGKRPKAYLRDDETIVLQVAAGSDAARRQAVLESLYRQVLLEDVPPLIAKWEPVMGVHVNEWRIKRMKTKWGTCNIEVARIWINLELAKKSPACLEYLVVHEMVHLLERSHNATFRNYMTQFLPNWKQLKAELNRGGTTVED